MSLLKLLQVSDLHLGASFGWLPRERRSERRRDQRRALEEAVRLAIERGAHAILLPGDLFDRDAVDAESLAAALHAFGLPGCPPVFIAPGNHDPWHVASPAWSERLLAARGAAWPPHVHVFTTAEWSSQPLAGFPVKIWGRCFVPNVSSAARPLEAAALAMIPPRGQDSAAEAGDTAAIHIALFHGSREGQCPPSQSVTAPFSDDEALGSPFAYLAAGHYHARSWLDDHDASRAAIGTRLAYAGSVVALDRTELGEHGALEVRIDLAAHPPRVETEPLPLDPRVTRELIIDASRAVTADLIDRRIEDAFDREGVTDRDIVTVRLTGRLMPGVRYGRPIGEIAERAFHLHVDATSLMSDLDLDALRAEKATTTEQRFARALIERLDAATEADERAMVEDALVYGLDAFRLHAVLPAPDRGER